VDIEEKVRTIYTQLIQHFWSKPRTTIVCVVYEDYMLTVKLFICPDQLGIDSEVLNDVLYQHRKMSIGLYSIGINEQLPISEDQIKLFIIRHNRYWNGFKDHFEQSESLFIVAPVLSLYMRILLEPSIFLLDDSDRVREFAKFVLGVLDEAKHNKETNS